MKLDTRNLGPLMAELRAVPGDRKFIVTNGKTELCGEAEYTVTEDAVILDFTAKVAKVEKRKAKK